MRNNKTAGSKGFTLIELLVVMGIIALLLAILLPVLGRARAYTKQVKDSKQVGDVHKGFQWLSRDNNGVFPSPGLADRLPVNGVNIPGKGAEDQTQNHHAAMYSLCIMRNALTTDILVSPAEVSTQVLVLANYNFDAYNPTGSGTNSDQFWDPQFQANLSPGQLCHVSYGTLHPLGLRRAQQWRDTLDSKFVVVGNRGVINGSLTPTDYLASKTLQIHGGAREWEGNLVFNDGHVTFERTFQPAGHVQWTQGTTTIDDNIFREDPEAAGRDSWLTVCSAIAASGTNYTATIHWD